MSTSVTTFKDSMHRGIKLAESLGASAAKISLSSSEAQSISYENSRLKSASGTQRIAYNISVILNGRRGTASGNQPEHLETLVRRAVELARIGAKSHFTTYPKPADHYLDIKSHDPKVTQILTRQKLVDDCGNLVEFLNSLGDHTTVGAGAGTSEGETLTVNSAGLEEEAQVSAWSISADLQRTTGTDLLELYAGRSWQKLNEFYDLDYIKSSIQRDFIHAESKDSLPDGKYPLVVPPLFMDRFLHPLYGAVSGRNVFRGISPLKDDLNKALFSPNFTVRDDPHVDYDYGSYAMDSAGLPTQKLTLVENGTLKQFLYDYDTACMAKAIPTGNSGCEPYNPKVMPGKTSSQELLGSLSQGLIIRDLLGFEQGNFMNGDFSANVGLGFAIRNGQFTGRLKNTMISGNIFELLKQPILISSDLEPVTRQPYIIFPEVNVFSR